MSMSLNKIARIKTCFTITGLFKDLFFFKQAFEEKCHKYTLIWRMLIVPFSLKCLRCFNGQETKADK